MARSAGGGSPAEPASSPSVVPLGRHLPVGGGLERVKAAQRRDREDWGGMRSAGPSSGVLLWCYRFDEVRRSARSLSISVPSGGPVQALPGPGRLRFRKSQRSERTSHYRLRHIPLSPTTPTAGGSGQQPDPRTVRVSPSNLSPLDRPPPPQMVAGHAPFPRDEVEALCR